MRENVSRTYAFPSPAAVASASPRGRGNLTPARALDASNNYIPSPKGEGFTDPLWGTLKDKVHGELDSMVARVAQMLRGLIRSSKADESAD